MMTTTKLDGVDLPGLIKDFSVTEDSRQPQAVRHLLLGILVMALYSMAMGADGGDKVPDSSELLFEWYQSIVPRG
jgi:hypothetical protein